MRVLRVQRREPPAQLAAVLPYQKQTWRRGSDQPSGVLSVIDNWSIAGARACVGSGLSKKSQSGALCMR